MAQRFRVSGRDVDSDQPIELLITAESMDAAIASARQRGIQVEGIALEVNQSVARQPASPRSTQTPLAEHPNRPPPKPRKRDHRIWLGLVLLGAFIAAPFVPGVPLWIGIVVIVLCVLAHVPSVQKAAHWTLRINPEKKWNAGFRIAAYGLTGLLLVTASLVGRATKAEGERIEAARVAKEAEDRRIVAEANAAVLELVSTAESAWEGGDRELVLEKLDAASRIRKATDRRRVWQLQSRIANADVSELVGEAETLLRSRETEQARKTIESALSIQHATELQVARRIGNQIAIATDVSRVRSILLALSDTDFGVLQDRGTLPKRLATGFAVLDELTLSAAQPIIGEVVAAREVARQQRLARKREAAEAARRAEEDLEREEYGRLSNWDLRRQLIANARWWVDRKRLRLDQALMPGSGHDVSEARADYEEALVKLQRLLEEEERYQELHDRFSMPARASPESAVPLAIALEKLASGSLYDRLEALDALAGLSNRVPERFFDALRTAAHDEHQEIRWKAIFVLGEMQGRTNERVGIFVGALADPSLDVRRWAWSGLHTIARQSPSALEPAVEELARLASSPKTPLQGRLFALCLLGDLGSAAVAARPLLRAIIQRDGENERLHEPTKLAIERVEGKTPSRKWAADKERILIMANDLE